MKYKIFFPFLVGFLVLGCAGESEFSAPPPSVQLEACELSLPSDGGSIAMCFKTGKNKIYVQWNGELSSEDSCTFDVTEKQEGDGYKAYKITASSTEEAAIISMLDQWLYKSHRVVSGEFRSEESELREAYVNSINRVKELVKDRSISPYCK